MMKTLSRLVLILLYNAQLFREHMFLFLFARRLRSRWDGEEERINLIVAALKCGEEDDWTRFLLKSEDDGWDDMPLLDSCPRRFWLQSESGPRDLRGLPLTSKDLAGITNMGNSCLDLCQFSGTTLYETIFRGTSMRYASIEDSCTLAEARFEFCNLYHADFFNVGLDKVVFNHCTLSGCDFRSARFNHTSFEHPKFTNERWYSFLVPYYFRKHRWIPRWTRFGGYSQSDQRLTSNTGDHIRECIRGENFAFRQQSFPMFALIWYILTNFGRSPSRLVFWVVTIWLGFGSIYSGYALPTFLSESCVGNILLSLCPVFVWPNESLDASWFTPYFYSMMVLTSLGTSNAYPAPDSLVTHIFILIESCIGIIMFGMLVSLLLNRIK